FKAIFFRSGWFSGGYGLTLSPPLSPRPPQNPPTTDYPMRIVVLSEHHESKDLSPTFTLRNESAASSPSSAPAPTASAKRRPHSQAALASRSPKSFPTSSSLPNRKNSAGSARTPRSS